LDTSRVPPTTIRRLVGRYLQRFLQLSSLKKLFVGLSLITIPLLISVGFGELALNPMTRARGAIRWFATAGINAMLFFWAWEELTELKRGNRIIALLMFGIVLVFLINHELIVAAETAEDAATNQEVRDAHDLFQGLLTQRLVAQLNHPAPATVTQKPISPVPTSPIPNIAEPQSFPFLVPGVWVNSNAWDFIVNHRGPKPSYNVEILFVDDVKRDQVTKGKTSISPDELNSYQQILKYDEVDPKGRGRIFARQFLWTPPIADHERYTIDATWRDGSIHQELQIERVDEKWFWATQIKNNETGELLVNCRDKGFPGAGPQLAPCFPAMLNPGN
jgi:hypothetical protein